MCTCVRVRVCPSITDEISSEESAKWKWTYDEADLPAHPKVERAKRLAAESKQYSSSLQQKLLDLINGSPGAAPSSNNPPSKD